MGVKDPWSEMRWRWNRGGGILPSLAVPRVSNFTFSDVYAAVLKRAFAGARIVSMAEERMMSVR